MKRASSADKGACARAGPIAIAHRARSAAVPIANLPGFMIGEIGRRNAEIARSEEHSSELQSHLNLVCRLLLEKKNRQTRPQPHFRRRLHAPRVRGGARRRQW